MVRLHAWWQRVKQRPFTTVGILAFIALIFLGYWFHWTWTGFNKTLWDWMQLLIVPVALALVAIWFNRNERKSDQKVASDNQRETALQAYIDKMSELLQEKHLRESQPSDEVRNIARARTLTVLPRLDPERKRSVLEFLHEANLINKNERIVSLVSADLREADLHGICLFGSELSGADFSGAKLTGARLEEANLYGADLTNAILGLPEQKTERFADLLESTLAMRAQYSLQDISNAAFLTGYFMGKGSNTNLRSANLCLSILTAADLRGVDFCKARLHRAFLVKAKMQKAILQEASLKEALLIEANLQEADLRGADLSEAILHGADLTGADLSGAVLTGAEVTKEQLEKAKSLKGATMPDGSKHP